MTIPARTLRATIDERYKPLLTPRQQERETRILAQAPTLLALYGPHAIGFTELAIALRMAPKTLRDHFVDVPALLTRILQNHLLQLIRIVAAIPESQPAARRAAYLQHTREAFGRRTETHTLLARDRHLLPEPERETIEQMRQQLGETLAGDLAHQTLTLLDMEYTEPALLEPMIEALETAARLPGTIPPMPAKPPEPKPLAAAETAPEAEPPHPGAARSLAGLPRLARQLENYDTAQARSPPQPQAA